MDEDAKKEPKQTVGTSVDTNTVRGLDTKYDDAFCNYCISVGGVFKINP